MRLLKFNLLTDGKLFNDGRPVDLIRIEDEKDFDILVDNIFNSGYYNSSYFDSHMIYQEGEVRFDSFFLSSILKFLDRGDIPRSLQKISYPKNHL